MTETEELSMYRDLSKDMYESLEQMWRFVATNMKETPGVYKVLPKAGAATERYMRQVLGDNVGCVPRVEDELKALRKVAERAKALTRYQTFTAAQVDLENALTELDSLG